PALQTAASAARIPPRSISSGRFVRPLARGGAPPRPGRPAVGAFRRRSRAAPPLRKTVSSPVPSTRPVSAPLSSRVTNQPDRPAVHKAPNILPADQRYVFAEAAPVKIEQAMAMGVFIPPELGELLGLGRMI